MQGIPDPPQHKGIIPRTFEHVFDAIEASENIKYLVHASYLEIYNEEIRDLLGSDCKRKLELKENPERGVYVAGPLLINSNLIITKALLMFGKITFSSAL